MMQGEQTAPPATLGAEKKRCANQATVFRVGEQAQLDTCFSHFKQCSVPARAYAAMFQPLQVACRRHDSAHSSLPSKKEEGRTCKEVNGASTEFHKHTPVPSYISSLCSKFNKVVPEHATRPRTKGAVMYSMLKKSYRNIDNKETEHGYSQEGAITRGC